MPIVKYAFEPFRRAIGTSFLPCAIFHSFRYYAAVHRRRNEAIRSESIILIDEKGLNHGIKNCKTVLEHLNRKLYDLVEMSQKDTMPICKVMPTEPQQQQLKDRSESNLSKKLLVDRTKSDTAATPPKSKEMNFSSVIAAHDYTRKMNQTKEFLTKGYLVQLSISGKESGDSTSKEKQEESSKKNFYSRLMKDLQAYGILKGSVRQSAYQWSWIMLGHKKEPVVKGDRDHDSGHEDNDKEKETDKYSNQ